MIVLVTPLDGRERDAVEVTRIEEFDNGSRSSRSVARPYDGDRNLGDVDLNKVRVEILPRSS